MKQTKRKTARQHYENKLWSLMVNALWGGGGGGVVVTLW